MGWASNIVRVGWKYIQAVSYELEAAIEEPPSWFEAYRKATLLQRLIRGHLRVVEEVLWNRLCGHPEADPPEFYAWLIENEHLVTICEEVAASVHDRDADGSAKHLARLALFLSQGEHEIVDVVLRVEALVGDLSDDLGNALHQIERDRASLSL